MSDLSELDAVKVRACLAEAGRPDLAREVGTNRVGDATISFSFRQIACDEDLGVIWKAHRLVRGRE